MATPSCDSAEKAQTSLARSLEPKLEGRSLALASDEFCAASIQEAMLAEH